VPFFYKQFHFALCIPFFIHEYKKTHEHYWEMGCKNYSKNIIKNILSEHFTILTEFQPILNPYHYFFVLKIK